MKKMNIDTLGKMSDNEIEFLLRKIRLEINNIKDDKRKKRKGGYDKDRLFDAQIEYCYVKRECDSRYLRKETHRLYLESNPPRYEEKFIN
jgi:hypothetical protein